MTRQGWAAQVDPSTKHVGPHGHLVGLTILLLGAGLVLSGRWASAEFAASMDRTLLRTSVARVELVPSHLELPEGQASTFDVMVYNASNLCGYELHLSFDPSVLQVVDMDPVRTGINVAPGDFVSPDFSPLNECSNITGTVSIAVTQVGRDPQSGDGCLVSMMFDAAGVGDSALRFDGVSLADDQGLEVEVDAVQPAIVVSGALTGEPSPTATVKPSHTPTIDPGPSPTSTPDEAPVQTTATAFPTPYYYVDPQVLELNPGETGDMVIRTSYVEGLGGVEVWLRWDPSLVSVEDANPSHDGVQVLPGDLFDGHFTYTVPSGNEANNVSGELLYVLGLSVDHTHPGVSGEWSVATVTFRGVGTGSSAVEFLDEIEDHIEKKTYMTSPAGLSISCGWIDGEVHVAEPTATPSQTPTITPTATPTSTNEPTIPATLPPTETETPTAVQTVPTVPGPTATPTTRLVPTIMSYVHIPLIIKDSVG